jgi:hypothetical protein
MGDMSKYILVQDDDKWSIVDEATQAPAKIDGVWLAHMQHDEARQMIKILRGIDVIRGASTRTAVSAKRLGRLALNGAGCE